MGSRVRSTPRCRERVFRPRGRWSEHPISRFWTTSACPPRLLTHDVADFPAHQSLDGPRHGRKVNCHAKGCYRVGLHKVDGTPYITCKKHHPVHPGGAVSAQIAEAHALAHQPPAEPDPSQSPTSAASPAVS